MKHEESDSDHSSGFVNKKKSIKNKNEFLNYMLDLLEPMGELSYKPLFGGYAICKHDAAFALVFDGAVYFKTDTTNQKREILWKKTANDCSSIRTNDDNFIRNEKDE